MKQLLFVCVFLCAFLQSHIAFGQATYIHVSPKVRVMETRPQYSFDSTPNLRTPTVADALALKSINRIAASPTGAQVAIEVKGEILILSGDYPFAKIKVLNGTYPNWSPDESMLAFYAEMDGKSQIEVWNTKQNTVQQITQLPEGISANPHYDSGLGSGDTRSFTWSPDSKRIAFCSRVMEGYEALGQRESPDVRVLSKDTWYSQVMEGVFHTDHLGDRPEDVRSRAIERHPELGLNKLFIVDVQTKNLRQLTQSGNQPFFPSWSPDGTKLVAVVQLDKNIEQWPSHTSLGVYDLQTGLEQRITTPFCVNGPPRWSVDGSGIVVASQQRLLGFPRIELYMWRERRWMSIGTPRGMATKEVRWASNKGWLLVETYDRFVNTLWLIEAHTGKARQIATHDLAISEFDQASNGELFFSASSASFAGRVFKDGVDGAEPLQQVFDANPQLSALEFGQQRRVTWRNKSGDEVDGILILPPNYQPGRRYPVLIDVYPTPAKDNLRLFADELGQLQAARGYVIFKASLRSPHTPSIYSRDENYNEKARGAKGIPIMIDDFISGVDYLVKQGIADSERIGIFGHSNGGWVVNYLIIETNLAKCAVVWSGSSSVIYQEYFAPQWAHEITDGNIYEKFDDYIKMSPLFRMNKVQTPLLMIVGDRDWDTWLPEMLAQFSALKQLRKDVTMLRYANEGHVFSSPDDITDFRARVDAFFDQHLRAGQSTAH